MTLMPATHVYKTVGNCPIKADVYRLATTPVPSAVVVFIHGGALINGRARASALGNWPNIWQQAIRWLPLIIAWRPKANCRPSSKICKMR